MADLTSMRGAAASVQYITRDRHGYRLAKSIDTPDVLNHSIGGKNALLIKDKSLPLVNNGDEVEVTDVINSRSGWLEVGFLKNSSTGVDWKFNRSKAVFGF